MVGDAGMDGYDHSARFTRREVIQMLGGAAGLRMVSGCMGDQAAPWLAGVPPDAGIRPWSGVISSGDIKGLTRFHQHLYVRVCRQSPFDPTDVCAVRD